MTIMETAKLYRVVIDTNILVSSLLGKGSDFTVIERFKQNHFLMYINGNLMKEYDTKLNQLLKDHLLKDSVAVGQLLNEIRLRAAALRILIDPPIRSTDPKDNCILEVALAGGLDFIITNDSKDLLSLNGNKALGNTKIIKSPEFFTVSQ